MYCLTNMCYVCLEKKDNTLINISSSSVNENIIHIIDYLPFDLAWMKTKQFLLICEECCLRLRETDQFLAMFLKNSSLMQGYLDKLNTGSISTADNEADLRVNLNNKHNDIIKIKREIKVENEEIYMFETGPIIEESEEVFVNVDDSFVKEEDNWKREVEDDDEKSPMVNNSIESSDNETDTEISVNSNTHDTDSSEFTSTQVHTSNKNKLNTAVKKSHKCLTCSKSFISKASLQIHTRVHTGEKPYKCAICGKCFNTNSNLMRHRRVHNGEKSYQCSRCKKSFSAQSNLVRHMRTHTGEKPYECSTCKKYFSQHSNLIRHMRTHTGETVNAD